MIDFYALTSPNAQKIFIMLEELELPYNLRLIDVWKSEQFSDVFTRLNPNQKIPVIVDHEGPGGRSYTVIESGAILMYLADKTGRLLPVDRAQRFDVLQWLTLQIASVGPMCGQLVHFRRFAPTGNDYSVSRYRTEVNRLLDLYNQRLADRAFICDEYSIADIAAFPWLRNHELLGMSMTERPHIMRWVDAIAARPSVKRALAKVGTITSARDTASKDAKDRFFGRGRYARA